MIRDTGDKILLALKELYEKNPSDFEKSIINIYKEDNQYISKSKNNKRKPILILDTPFWFEKNLSLPQRIIIVFKIMDKLGCKSNEIINVLRDLTEHSKP